MAKNGLTHLEKRRKNLKELGEWDEKIKEMGHENEERGIKAVKEVQKEGEKKLKKTEEKFLNQLDISKKKNFEYKKALISWGFMTLMGIKLPKGYDIFFDITEKGVVVGYRDPVKREFKRGLVPSFDPRSDLLAVEEKVYDCIDWVNLIADSNIKNVENGRK